MKKAIAQMIQSLLLSLAARSQLQELRDKIRSPAVDKGPVLKAKPPATQKDILGVCCDPLVLAQQLTHIELVSVVCLAWVGGGLITTHLGTVQPACFFSRSQRGGGTSLSPSFRRVSLWGAPG